MTLLRTSFVAVALTASLVLAGCGDDEPEAEATPTPTEAVEESPSETPSETPSPSESAAEEPGVAVDVTIAGDDVSPMAQAVEVGVGEPLVLSVDSDRAGELHVHSNPEQTFALSAGREEIEITFDKPGQVDIEEHESGALLLRVLVR
jgi:hypothetical protein